MTDDWHARRAALRARDAALDAGRESLPGRDGPIDETAIEAEAVEACRAAIGARVDLKPALEPGGVPEPLAKLGE